MTAKVFPISDVIQVSVSNPPVALNEYNTSNVALFTTELPANSFGTLGYALYTSPTQVGIDFGTSSVTYQKAVAMFSQNPNLLQNQGQLIIITMSVATQTLTPSGVAASGSWTPKYGGNSGTSLSWSATANQIQASLRTIPGLSEVTVTGTLATAIVVVMNGVYGTAPGQITANPNTLMTGGSAPVTLSAANAGGETIGAAITRTQGLVQYFGVDINHTLADIGQTDLLAAAAIIQALPLMGFFVSYTAADVAPGGMIDLLRTGSFTQTRGLYYQDPSLASNVNGLNAMLMASAYIGRGLSVNFSGSLTTITMNLKQLATINPDPNISSTTLAAAQTAGADVYVSIGGSPEVLSSGANQFFDNVYNQLWFAGAIQVALFNYLAQTSTKILQTEQGMTGLKNALAQVCLQAVGNGYLAPGAWNSATTFGVLADFYNNITQYGFYIYSSPVASQSATQRQNRVAPLIQVAAKLAGAIQSASVQVYINP